MVDRLVQLAAVALMLVLVRDRERFAARYHGAQDTALELRQRILERDDEIADLEEELAELSETLDALTQNLLTRGGESSSRTIVYPHADTA